MTDTLFKEVHYSLGGLINDIDLPDLQRLIVYRPRYALWLWAERTRTREPA